MDFKCGKLLVLLRGFEEVERFGWFILSFLFFVSLVWRVFDAVTSVMVFVGGCLACRRR